MLHNECEHLPPVAKGFSSKLTAARFRSSSPTIHSLMRQGFRSLDSGSSESVKHKWVFQHHHHNVSSVCLVRRIHTSITSAVSHYVACQINSNTTWVILQHHSESHPAPNPVPHNMTRASAAYSLASDMFGRQCFVCLSPSGHHHAATMVKTRSARLWIWVRGCNRAGAWVTGRPKCLFWIRHAREKQMNTNKC